jgi:hypothetical protein
MENVIQRAAEFHQPHRADKCNEPGADNGEIADVSPSVHVAVNYPAPFGDMKRLFPRHARNRAAAHDSSPPAIHPCSGFWLYVNIPPDIPSPSPGKSWNGR